MDYRFVYAIQHNVTKRIYIGSSANPKRIKQHFNALKRGDHQNASMQKDCDDNGFNFTAYLIETFPAHGNSYTERERFWINAFHSDNEQYGYNSPLWFSKYQLCNFPKFDEDVVASISKCR